MLTLLIIIIILLLVIGGIFMYKKIAKNNTAGRIYVFVDFILYTTFILCGLGVAFWFTTIMPYVVDEAASAKLYSSSDIKNADTLLQQIYYLASNADGRVAQESFFICTLFIAGIGLFLIFSIWSVLKYNRLEKRIMEIREITKREEK